MSETETGVETQFSIPEARLEEFKTRLKKLSKLAVKCGISAPAHKEIGEEFRVYVRNTDWDGRTYWSQANPKDSDDTPAALYERMSEKHKAKIVRFVTVEVVGERPQIAGWNFLAKLEHTAEGMLIMALSPEPVPAKYRQASPLCEHCQTKRTRKDTYVVKSESGDLKQVGRSCLKDFMGHQTPEHIANMCSYLEQLSGIGDSIENADEYLEGSGETHNYFSLSKVLTYTSVVVRESGYVSREEAERKGITPTGSEVEYMLFAKGERAEEIKKSITDADSELAEKVIAWGKSLADADTSRSDYLWNMSLIARLEMINYKRVALAASMLKAYQRAMGIEVVRKNEIDPKRSDHFGREKDRIEFEATVISIEEKDGSYGVTYLHKFWTSDGNLAVWWASDFLDAIDENGEQHQVVSGDVIRLKATIKRHDEFRGVKQTIITRANVLELVRAENQENKQAVA